MTSYETIKNQFEAKALCRQKQRPVIHLEPGCVWVECRLSDGCKCRIHGDSGEPLTPMLAEWESRFG